jgi:5-bromo-4-chloroindolyl phosphate hydrolysis protein
MKRLLRTMWRWFVVGNVGIAGTLLAFFAFDWSFLLSILFGGSIGYGISLYMKRKEAPAVWKDTLKDERAYRRQQLKEARKKVRRIGQSRFRIRSLAMWYKLSRLYNVCQKMIDAAEQEPVRFRAAQSFFNTTLDSIVTIVEKYVYLTKQPVRNDDMRTAIREAETMIDAMITTAENQLLDMLEGDLFDLEAELKVLKHSLPNDPPLSLEERKAITIDLRKEREDERVGKTNEQKR